MAEPATNIQTNFKAAGYWATVMAPPTSEKYRPTNTTTNTKKPKNDDALYDWEFYELYNVINYLNNNNLYFASNQPHFIEPETANGLVDVNGQVLAGATLGGLSTVVSSTTQAEETTETQLTADAPTLQEGGNEEYLKLWTDAKANANLDAEAKAFLKTVDPSIFAQELSEDTLENNKGFLSAAKILYNDENSDKSSGELSWDEHIAKKAADEGWGVGLPEDEKAAIIAQRAEEELGEWAIDHMANINYQTWEGGKAAIGFKEKSVSVQLATLYMMQAYEHKDATLSSSGRAIWKTVSDPVNLALMGGGALFAFFTGGTSIAGASALIAARQAAASGGRMAAIKAIQNTVINNGLKSALTVGALEGAAEGLAQDYFIQHTLEESGYNALKLDHEYSLSRGATTVLTSAVIGGALNELGVTAGTAFKKPKPDAPTPTPADVANEAIEETAEEVLENTAEKAAKPRVKVRADADGKYSDVTDQVETAKPRVKVQAYNKDNDVANQPEAPNAFNNAANNTGSRNSSNSITLEDGQDLDDWLVANNAEDWFFGLKKSQQKFIRARTENGKSFNGPSAQQTQVAPAPTAAAPTTPTPQQPATPTSAAPTEASTTPTTEASATPTGAGAETPSPASTTTTTTTEAGATTPASTTAPTTGASAGKTANTQGKNAPLMLNDNLLPHPKRSWMHTVTSEKNPIVFMTRLWNTKAEIPSQNLPNQLSFDQYILPLIDAVDGRLAANSFSGGKNAAELLNQLNSELGQINARLGTGNNTLTQEQAKNECTKLVADFLSSNKKDLEKLLNSFGPISDEMRLEKDLAVLADKVRDGKIQKDQAKQEAFTIFGNYTARSGREYTGVESRVEDILRGNSGKFHLKSHQANAMYNYVEQIQYSIKNLLDPNFTSKYEAKIDNAITTSTTGTPSALQAAILDDFQFLTKESSNAVMRSNPLNKSGSRMSAPSIAWGAFTGKSGTPNALAEINARRIGLRNGYFNPHKRKEPLQIADPQNLEVDIMKMEGADPTDGSKSSEIVGMMIAGYERGYDHEIIEAFSRLDMKTGGDSASRHLVDAVIKDLKSTPLYTAGDAHYRFFVDSAVAIASAKHNPNQWGQRDMLRIYRDWSFKPFHARKFPGAGNILSTPGRIVYRDDPLMYIKQKMWTYPLGFNVEQKKLEGGQTEWRPVFFKPPKEDATGFGKIKHYAIEAAIKQPIRMAWNIGTLPIQPGYQLTKLIVTNKTARNMTMFPLAGGLGLAGIEGTAEYFLPENTWVTDEEGNLIIPEVIPGIGGAHLDIGSRLLGGGLYLVDGALAPIRWNISGVNAIAEHAFDINSPINPDWVSVGDDALIPLTRWNAQLTGDRYEGLTATEAAEILSDFRDHNGYNPYDDIEPAKRRALIAQMVEDNQADPTGYDIQTLKVELTEEEKKKAKEEADAKAKADAEANGASTSPSTSGDAEATDTTPEGNSSPTLADAQNVASGAWDSVGNIFNAGANGALGSFDWMLTGKDAIGGGHLAADFKNAGSGFFNWVGDTWSDLANNRIKGGQKWLSFGLALLAAFPVMGFASQKLGALNIGGIPALIIGALTVGFGGGLINKLFKGQGNGSHVTTDVKQNTEQSVDHSGKDNTPKPPKPVPARVEDFSFKIKGKDAVLSDEDDAKTKGQDTLTYAVVQGGGKTNHVALSIVSNKDDAKKIVEQGQCTYVPFNLNPARGQTFDTTIEGVNHAGNEGKFAVFQGQDASNDPNAVCFELKAG